MTRVIVLGATGMLGRGVLEALRGTNFHVVGSSRNGQSLLEYPEVQSIGFDASVDKLSILDHTVSQGDYIINCIGIIKPYIRDEDAQERRVAMQINGIFPDDLARYAEKANLRVLQIATDCVYSGSTGMYSEESEFDALDVYGKTKSLGEVPSPTMMHLRVSIIGPETGRSSSLFEWVRNQPHEAEIFGFTDHLWNGVTTFHFGQLCRGIIEGDLFASGTYHLIPGSIVSKLELVTALAARAGRSDISIIPKASGKTVDRTLSTKYRSLNQQIWLSSGYEEPLNVLEMVAEMPI
jgi:dTDP-4-dehydrorhamnose reductase